MRGREQGERRASGKARQLVQPSSSLTRPPRKCIPRPHHLCWQQTTENSPGEPSSSSDETINKENSYMFCGGLLCINRKLSQWEAMLWKINFTAMCKANEKTTGARKPEPVKPGGEVTVWWRRNDIQETVCKLDSTRFLCETGHHRKGKKGTGVDVEVRVRWLQDGDANEEQDRWWTENTGSVCSL